MKRILHFIISTVLVMGFSFLQAQTYVGSTVCAGCHPDKASDWSQSGHPYKFNVIENNQPPVYPDFVTNFEDTWMANLGDGSHTWADIAGVIGGFGWKARFVGQDGVIIGTASSQYPDAGQGHNQFNFYGGVDYGWVDYDASHENKIYNYSCFKCHTTGGDTTGTWLPAVPGLGNFTEGGVGCEGCHGPGSEHAAGPTADNIDRVYEQVHEDNTSGGLTVYGVLQTPDPAGNDINFMCGTCHNRGYNNQIDVSGGFIRHHEQWDEFTTTDMYDMGLTCKTCHNPHKRAIWDGDGITKQCGDCHAKEVTTLNHSDGANCIDCHMPYAAKSGTTRGQSGYKGDIRSHLFLITVNNESMFTEDGKWVKDDDAREASLSPAFSCLGCHNDDPDDNIADMTLDEAVAAAKDMHEPTGIAENHNLLLGVYPNPTQGATKISVNLTQSGDVTLNIFNTAGQLVYTMVNNNQSAGVHVLLWDGNSNTGASVNPGYYFIKVSTANSTSVKKLVLTN